MDHTDSNRPYVGYIRVSTRSQGKTGIGFLRQEARLKKYAQLMGRRLDQIFAEVGSGAERGRPKLRTAIERAKLMNGDLLIEGSSRLARDAEFAKKIREGEGIRVEQLKMGALTTEEAQEALDHGAEEQRIENHKRSREGIKRAKKNGTKFGSGNPSAGGKIRGQQFAKKADEFASLMLPIIDAVIEELGGKPSLAKIAAKLNELGHPTHNGDEWKPMQVSRICAKRKRIEVTTSSPSNETAKTAEQREADYSDNPLWASWGNPED